MREINFRAWDDHTKEMISFYELVNNPEMLRDVFTASDTLGVFAMQFTGLHDRNGKEVFADDILKDSVGHLFRVYACIGGFAIKAEYWRSDLSDLIIGDELILTSLIDAQMQSYISGSVEIIGNRFENPELL